MKNQEMAQELLLNSLKSRNPILLVGAGFSRDAICNGKKLPLSADLKDSVYREFYEIDCPLNITQEEKNQLKNSSLSDLCKAIENDCRKNKLIKYLLDNFKGTIPDPENPYHELLTEYYWNKIYTLNIDDLIENIYKSKGVEYVVQNETVHKPVNQCRQIIKLHGCVNNPDCGFVFSSSEYCKNIVSEDYRLKEFARDFYANDVIFLGTQFNEMDIQILLEKNKQGGYNSRGLSYFFVSPSVNYALKSLINNTENFYYVPWDTETFLNTCATLNKQNNDIDKQEKLLEQVGFLKVQDYTNVPLDYESKLYYGNKVNFYDIFANWDIVSTKTKKIMEKICNKEELKNYAITLYGKSFTGKTVAAYRLLVELYNKGFCSYVYNCEGEEELDLLRNYLIKYNSQQKVAVLIDDAAYLYDSIKKFIVETVSNFKQLVFVLVSSYDMHMSKKYELIDSNAIEWQISDKFSDRSGMRIYNKLKEKNRLSNYRNMNEKKAIQQINKYRYLIEFLFNFTHGEGFKSYFMKKLSTLRNGMSSDNLNLIKYLCVLAKLDISSINEQLVMGLFPRVQPAQLDDLVVGFGESSGVALRCAAAYNEFACRLPESEKIEIIYQMALYISNMFREEDNNRWKIVFEKLLKTQSLMHNLQISSKAVIELFAKLEKYYSNVSYFWLQRGLAKQANYQFDDAENFLNQALSIRPNSYQIRHAIAKNKLDKAIKFSSKNKWLDEAKSLFDDGLNELMELIESPRYSNSLNYSVHSYINSVIKFHNKIHTNIDGERILTMRDILIHASERNFDRWMENSRCNLYSYCKEHCPQYVLEFDRTKYRKYRESNFIYRV